MLKYITKILKYRHKFQFQCRVLRGAEVSANTTYRRKAKSGLWFPLCVNVVLLWVVKFSNVLYPFVLKHPSVCL